MYVRATPIRYVIGIALTCYRYCTYVNYVQHIQWMCTYFSVCSSVRVKMTGCLGGGTCSCKNTYHRRFLYGMWFRLQLSVTCVLSNGWRWIEEFRCQWGKISDFMYIRTICPQCHTLRMYNMTCIPSSTCVDVYTRSFCHSQNFYSLENSFFFSVLFSQFSFFDIF